MKRVGPPQGHGWSGNHSIELQGVGREPKHIWDDFRSDPAYRSLANALSTAQFGLCAYCEGTIPQGRGSLDHVVPKAAPHLGAVTDPENLLLCCQNCNGAKAANQLPSGTDPRSLDWMYCLVRVDPDGTLSAEPDACARAGVATANLDAAISLLGLNSNRLKDERENHRNRLAAEAARDPADPGLLDMALKPDRTTGRLRPFWSTARHVLLPESDAWVAANATALRFP